MGPARLKRTVAVRTLLWSVALIAGTLKAVFAVRLYAQPDLGLYIGAVTTLAGGGRLYDFTSRSGDFIYPPFAGVLLLPLAFVPPDVARVVWTALTIVGVFVLAWIVARAAAPHVAARSCLWPAGVLVMLFSRPLHSNLRFGQVSFFLTMAVLADFFVLHRHRRHGALIGVCAAIKLTPLIFIPYLWLVGRKKATKTAAAVFGLATVSGALLLPQDSVTYWSNTVFQTSRMAVLDYLGNQSLLGVLLRMGVDPRTIRVVWFWTSVAIVLAAFRRGRWAWASGQPLLGVAIVGSAAVLASPVSWTHHRMWLLLAAAGTFVLGRGANWATKAVIVGIMTLPLPRLESAGPLMWVLDNRDMFLALAIACFLPVERPQPGTPEQRAWASGPACLPSGRSAPTLTGQLD